VTRPPPPPQINPAYVERERALNRERMRKLRAVNSARRRAERLAC
jgi:hypothetical protein